jgi:hypothetical protein
MLCLKGTYVIRLVSCIRDEQSGHDSTGWVAVLETNRVGMIVPAG